MSVDFANSVFDRDRKGPYSPSLPHHRAYGSVHGGSDSYALLSKAGLWVQRSATRDSVPSPAVAGASPRLSAEKSSSNCVFCRLSRMSKRFLLTTLSVQAFIQSLPVLRVLTVSPLSGECRNRADRLHWLTMPSADFCAVINRPCDLFSLLPLGKSTTAQISRGKFDRLPRTTAESTLRVLDGYGLCGTEAARPTLTPHIRFLFIGSRFC